MSDQEDADLGIQAFRDMSSAMDRLGATIDATERRHQLRTLQDGAEASKARTAAIEADMAAQKALQAAQTGLQAAKMQIRSSLTWTALTAVLGTLLAFSGGYWAGRASGWDQGQAFGYAGARDEIAAAAWANTPSGRRALTLDQLGSLDTLTGCKGQNWRTSTQDGHRVCFPAANAQGQMTGWFVP